MRIPPSINMKYVGKFTPLQQYELLDLLWDYLIDDPDYPGERVRTSAGTKTKTGLLACIERIIEGDK